MRKNTKETIAQEAKRLLESVPANKWIIDQLTDKEGKCCALGHYGRLKNRNPNDYSLMAISWTGESGHHLHKLTDITAEYIKRFHCSYANIAAVNNGPRVNGYTEPEIKDRVMHLLDDMILAGY